MLLTHQHYSSQSIPIYYSQSEVNTPAHYYQAYAAKLEELELWLIRVTAETVMAMLVMLMYFYNSLSPILLPLSSARSLCLSLRYKNPNQVGPRSSCIQSHYCSPRSPADCPIQGARSRAWRQTQTTSDSIPELTPNTHTHTHTCTQALYWQKGLSNGCKNTVDMLTEPLMNSINIKRYSFGVRSIIIEKLVISQEVFQ